MFEENHTQAIALAIAHEIMRGATWQDAREIIAEEIGHTPFWPSSDIIEQTLRSELYLLEPDHAAILREWRLLALYISQMIDIPLYLTGSVLNGSATVYSNLRLAVFNDDPKSVEIALMQGNIDFEVINVEPANPPATIAYGWLVPIPRHSIFRQKDKHLHFVGIRLEVFREKDFFTNRHQKSPDQHQLPWEASGRLPCHKINALINTS